MDAHRHHGVERGEAGVEGGGEGGEILGAGQIHMLLRLELDDGGEGHMDVVVEQMHRAIAAHLIEMALQPHQFAVEAVDGADAEIAVAVQVADGHRAVVNPLQEGVDDRGLVEGVGVVGQGGGSSEQRQDGEQAERRPHRQTSIRASSWPGPGREWGPGRAAAPGSSPFRRGRG